MSTTPHDTDRTETLRHADPRWLLLQRTVAAAMIVTLLSPMLVVVQRLIPPLAVPAVLFALLLALTTWRPRGSAIAIGSLSGVWLLLQVANLSRVVPDLLRPEDTIGFVITVAMLVVPVAGGVGLVGMLRRASGRFASATLATAGGLLGSALLGGVIAGAVTP